MKVKLPALPLLSLLLLLASAAFADTLSLGTVLPNFGIVSVGKNAYLNANSGPIQGPILVGYGSKTTSSGGNNGSVIGGVDVSGSEATGSDNLQHLQTKPTVKILDTTGAIGKQAYTDALTLSNTAKGLTADKKYTSTVSGAVTITGKGGLTVVDFTSLQNPVLTVKGDSKDFFVFNVSGLLNTNKAMILSGITASQILWNFTGTSNTVFQTSGGNKLYGTFLATDGGSFQFSELALTGELINTDGKIQFVSGSKMTFTPPTPPTPEPESMALLASGLLLMAGLLRRKRR